MTGERYIDISEDLLHDLEEHDRRRGCDESIQAHHRRHLALAHPAGPGDRTRIAVAVLNRMLDLGRPDSVRAA